MSGRVIGFAWLAATLPALGVLALVENSDRNKREFRAQATGRAEGTIVAVEEERGKHIRFRPTVAFTAPGGEAVRFRSIQSEIFPPERFKAGARLPVVFVPSAPAKAEIDDPSLREDDGGFWRVAVGAWVGVMTALFGGIAAALAWSRRRGDQPAR